MKFLEGPPLLEGFGGEFEGDVEFPGLHPFVFRLPEFEQLFSYGTIGFELFDCYCHGCGMDGRSVYHESGKGEREVKQPSAGICSAALSFSDPSELFAVSTGSDPLRNRKPAM